MLRCVEPFVFSLTDPAKVQIEIKEMGIRVITLSTDEKVEARKLYAILVKLICNDLLSRPNYKKSPQIFIFCF